MNKKVRSSLIVLFLIISMALMYFLTPVLSVKFYSFYIIFIPIAAIIGITRSLAKNKVKSKAYYIPGILIILFLCMFIITLPIFRASSYKNLLPTPKYEEFSKNITPIDIKEIPTVNQKYAELLADKKLGEETSLGSKVELGDLTLQNVNGKLYYVAPLVHSGFMKWLLNDSTPGYVTVSATNDKDVKLVRKLNGKDIKIKYQPEAFFNDDLKRHIYLKGTLNKGITDLTFELDDKGNPYFTATLYDNKVGMSGLKAVGTAVVNPETGEVKKYSVENTPKWVDRIQPQSFVESNLKRWGKYIKGFFNFSGQDKLKTTEGTGVIYNNGKCYYYTGLTSVGKDESSIGFALIDTRTQQTRIFKIAGATETASMKSAEGKVQNLGYKATFPILINVDNVPTYFTTLNDKNDLTKMFAMISVTDYNIIGTGENITECKSNYIKNLASKGNLINVGSTGKEENVTDTIERINSYVVGNSTIYTFVLKNHKDQIFNAGISISNELPITKEGDSVNIRYVDTKQDIINASYFDNKQFSQKQNK
ncbi:cell shape-determining protein [Clostridium sp. Marseille-Q2269]|uniref:cell shape-determining protein n=1 Tax=Clostridium sp. Marseille-Q2269 TaxID=2942205 RepID=UPI002073B312|nr:cell shape-determining protein [Clostridium sp. Marseille-Q2269]